MLHCIYPYSSENVSVLHINYLVYKNKKKCIIMPSIAESFIQIEALHIKSLLYIYIETRYICQCTYNIDIIMYFEALRFTTWPLTSILFSPDPYYGAIITHNHRLHCCCRIFFFLRSDVHDSWFSIKLRIRDAKNV